MMNVIEPLSRNAMFIESVAANSDTVFCSDNDEWAKDSAIWEWKVRGTHTLVRDGYVEISKPYKMESGNWFVSSYLSDSGLDALKAITDGYVWNCHTMTKDWNQSIDFWLRPLAGKKVFEKDLSAIDKIQDSRLKQPISKAFDAFLDTAIPAKDYWISPNYFLGYIKRKGFIEKEIVTVCYKIKNEDVRKQILRKLAMIKLGSEPSDDGFAFHPHRFDHEFWILNKAQVT